MNHLKVFLSLLIGMHAVLSLRASEPPPGWGTLTWGMTSKQILKERPSIQHLPHPLTCKIDGCDHPYSLFLHHVQVADQLFTAKLITDSANRLIAVRLDTPEEKNPGMKEFENVRDLMVKRYSAPTSETKTGESSGASAIWKGQTTVVELHLSSEKTGCRQQLTLVYRSTSISAD